MAHPVADQRRVHRGSGRNFDVVVDGMPAFDDFKSPALGIAPFSAIAHSRQPSTPRHRPRAHRREIPPSRPRRTRISRRWRWRASTRPRQPRWSLWNRSRVEGDPGLLSVHGISHALLEWFKGPDLLPGKNGPELDFPSLTVDAGSYTLRATSSLGTDSSDAAVVAVGVQPSGLLRQLRGWWKFDETSGTTAADSSPYTNAGTLMNFPEDGTQWVAGRTGGALVFRGTPSNDFVRVTEYLIPRGPISVSAWVWADARPSWASIAKSWPRLFRFGLDGTTGATERLPGARHATDPRARSDGSRSGHGSIPPSPQMVRRSGSSATERKSPASRTPGRHHRPPPASSASGSN